ncbi:MAG: hypothetical protein QM589_17210 [Thermomicrobiales bacterium]
MGRYRSGLRRLTTWPRIVVALALLGIPSSSGTPLPSDTHRVEPAGENPMFLTILTRDPRTNLPLPGACYIVLGVTGERCDDAGTGNVHFADVRPGTYRVVQMRVPAGFLGGARFTVTVAPQGPAYQWAFVNADVDPSSPATLTIRTVDRHTGETIPGVCLGLEGTGIAGCDADGDGTIELRAVPAGVYDIAVQRAPGNYRIAFTASAPVFVPARNRQVIVLPLRDYDDAAANSQ